ncbi:KR domain-containing protein [Lactonifactor longoviformis]|uniref:Gluconate 5-dehydrogenase n=1 Tax=Lactonifactor longoviformis DSM 17459 TaxID=1122155 RepID=A0A1M4VLH1_9CLOT|nr:SDR family NAD(P)-dependent oxidoreductase [Lactonifactor longoviformis]POP34193.1 KR domain-containing protein [Lactonifactor longoviformis]SHE69936.1 gluconate 5-dehydrogenase [Lactonifactor longoviformis DSM 17459]
MFDLTGNVAVVTGASAGLGRQFALALARQGADVAILARRKEKLEAVAKEIEALGVTCLPVACDVTDTEQIKGAVEKVVSELGTVDILVNNAGGGSCIPLEELPDEEWRKVLTLDLDGAFYCMKYFGRVMLEKGYGRVINIASILGKGGLKELPVIAYASAKGGIINMTRQAATEWAEKGVTVNALCPGFFASEANGPEAMQSMNDFIVTRTAMSRPGRDGELDSSVVFLAAKESTYVTGAILTCDGGWTAI